MSTWPTLTRASRGACRSTVQAVFGPNLANNLFASSCNNRRLINVTSAQALAMTILSSWGGRPSNTKHLFVAAKVAVAAAGAQGMTNGTSSALNSEQDLASIPMAGGGLSRLAIARLKSAGVPVAPLLRRAGLTPEVIADPEERLSVRSQIALLDEAAIALKDDCIGFTLARDFDPREIGLLYYVMASSQTLGDALKRIARYSKITNEALVFGYQE